MAREKLIPADEFCVNYNIEISFIHSLQDSGLIEVITIEDIQYIRPAQVQELEKIVHLYYELDINLEGIETITHLLHRVRSLQAEITELKNRLRLHESL